MSSDVVLMIMSCKLTSTGWAVFPLSHSSALKAGMSPTVSGYRSSWNNSD